MVGRPPRTSADGVLKRSLTEMVHSVVPTTAPFTHGTKQIITSLRLQVNAELKQNLPSLLLYIIIDVFEVCPNVPLGASSPSGINDFTRLLKIDFLHASCVSEW